MLEEAAQVIRIEKNQVVWVETQRRSGCDSCAGEKACGTAILSKVLGNRRNVVRALSAIPLKVGDRVIIGIREQALVRGSLAVYAVPVLLLLLGGLIGELGAQQFIWENGELVSVLLGLSGLLAGLVWLKRFTHRIQDDPNFQPVVLRRQNSAGVITTE